MVAHGSWEGKTNNKGSEDIQREWVEGLGLTFATMNEMIAKQKELAGKKDEDSKEALRRLNHILENYAPITASLYAEKTDVGRDAVKIGLEILDRLSPKQREGLDSYINSYSAISDEEAHKAGIYKPQGIRPDIRWAIEAAQWILRNEQKPGTDMAYEILKCQYQQEAMTRTISHVLEDVVVKYVEATGVSSDSFLATLKREAGTAAVQSTSRKR